MTPLRTAVVGVGAIGSLHARIYSEHPLAALSGVVDTNPVTARAVAERLRVPWFTEVSDLLDRCDFSGCFGFGTRTPPLPGGCSPGTGRKAPAAGEAARSHPGGDRPAGNRPREHRSARYGELHPSLRSSLYGGEERGILRSLGRGSHDIHPPTSVVRDRRHLR